MIYEVNESKLVLIKCVLFICLQLKMDKTKEEFVVFIRDAMDNKQSASFAELYNFLLGCFVRADIDLKGKVFINQFDPLIEEAAALPRKYGLAPKASDMYPNQEARRTARGKMFKTMTTATSDYITLDRWIDFAIKHIMGKAKTLEKDHLGGNCTKEEFIVFIKKAVNKSNPEFKELYFFLLNCFKHADLNDDGLVDHKEFDSMIEEAAAAPRKHGLAPATSVMFRTETERLTKRLEYFKMMDIGKDNNISFDQWLNYAMEHIMGKVAALK